MSDALRPAAIFFDMDGTLLDWQTGMDQHWRDVCELGCADARGLEAGVLYDAIVERRTWFWADPARAKDGRMDLNEASRQIVLHAMRDLAHNDEALAGRIATEYRARRLAAIACYPGAIDVVREVRRRGIRTALITNGGGTAQRHSVERFGLDALFDCIVIEGEFGCGKPDERVFRHALASCDVRPSDAWMVGDSLEADIATPVDLGMHAIWIDEAGNGVPEGSAIRPHRIIRSVTELL